MPFRYNLDGSLDLYFQNESPGPHIPNVRGSSRAMLPRVPGADAGGEAVGVLKPVSGGAESAPSAGRSHREAGGPSAPCAGGHPMVTVIQGYPPSDHAVVRDHLISLGVEIRLFRIDRAAFDRYVSEAKYPESYVSEFGPLFAEKALEHWVSLRLLAGVRPYDVGVDVAAWSSPYFEIQWRLSGVPTYRQDIAYAAEDREPMKIGGPAEHLPFGDGALARLTLHRSLEHFEGEADSGLIHEAARVLRPGGKLCIVPLYVAERFHNVTDPEVDRTGLTCRRSISA